MTQEKVKIIGQTVDMKEIKEEIALLATLVRTFEKFSEEAKLRSMKYFMDRFNKYVPSENYYR